MSLLKPTPPPYDPFEWRQQPWATRIRMACQAWAIQGYGSPFAVYFLYLIKCLVYVGLWCFFVSFTPGLGDPRTIGQWCFSAIAFQKAVLWSMAFEGLGLGCASGPLTARYWPPFGGFLHFLRPGTTKLPLFPGLPILGGTRRTLLDVAFYFAHYCFLFRALTAPELNMELFLPMVILLPLLGISDKTVFLASRSEHYYTTLVCFLFPDWIAGAIAVQVAIWFWAAVSKLTHHFPSVVAVMTSNSPCIPFAAVRKLMYRSYPDDLRPSRLAVILAHLGTAAEFTFPIILATSSNGWTTLIGLIMMVSFHAYITSNFPMAVPIEWNIHVVYGAFFLFWQNSSTGILDLYSPLLIAFLFTALILIPIVGNFFPAKISFLASMRYYAGNWPYSVWLFRKDKEPYKKIENNIKKSSAWFVDQLSMFYDEKTIAGLLGKIPAFRAMHLQGRVLHPLLPKAVDDLEAYEYIDGEIIAGMVLGWNFGDGHLHNEQLLRAIQEQCNFKEGELRCIFVESQPLFGSTMKWCIADAKAGVIDRGEALIGELLKQQPWPEKNKA